MLTCGWLTGCIGGEAETAVMPPTAVKELLLGTAESCCTAFVVSAVGTLGRFLCLTSTGTSTGSPPCINELASAHDIPERWLQPAGVGKFPFSVTVLYTGAACRSKGVDAGAVPGTAKF